METNASNSKQQAEKTTLVDTPKAEIFHVFILQKDSFVPFAFRLGTAIPLVITKGVDLVCQKPKI